MIYFCIYHGSNIKAQSKMFAPNRHDRLIERQKKLDIPEFHSKNMKLTDFNKWFFISLPLLKLLADVYAPVHD